MTEVHDGRTGIFVTCCDPPAPACQRRWWGAIPEYRVAGGAFWASLVLRIIRSRCPGGCRVVGEKLPRHGRWTRIDSSDHWSRDTLSQTSPSPVTETGGRLWGPWLPEEGRSAIWAFCALVVAANSGLNGKEIEDP